MILWVSKRIPKLEDYAPRDVIGVDIIEERSTGIGRAERFMVLAGTPTEEILLTKIPSLEEERHTEQD